MEHDVKIESDTGAVFDVKIFEDLLRGDDVQQISVVQSLPQLISMDSSAVFNRIIPKIKQDLPSSSNEFQIATSTMFMSLLQQTSNTMLLQAIITGIDHKDPNVSAAWAEALFGSMPYLPEITMQNYVLPLAKQKFQPQASIHAKILCCKLMGEICSNSKFRLLDVKRDILPIVIGLCQDGQAEVRAQMCSFLPKVVTVLGNDWEKTNLLSCIVDLAQDENLNVRTTSIVAITSMLRILNHEITRNTLLPLVKKLCNKACEEPLVAALIISDEFGPLMHEMPSLNDQDVLFFVRIYKQLSMKGKQSNAVKANASMEVTIRQRCAKNSYGIMKLVLQSLPSQLPEVYTLFREHAIDPCYLVRRSAAGILADIAQLLGKENLMMKNEIVRLLRDDALEVLDAIVPTISGLFTSLVNSGAIDYTETSQTSIELCKALIKCQSELSKRYNWRLTIEFMKQLEVLPTCIPSDYIHNNFTPNLIEKMIFGKAKPIRQQAARTMVVFMRYNFKPNQNKWMRDTMIKQTALARSCHSRILYFYLCEAVLDIYSEKYFKEWFLSPCLQLASDRVVNVRWKFMHFSSKLKSMVSLASDIPTKQKIMNTITKLETAERSKSVLDIIRIKKREPLPKYWPDALKEEECRVKNEATTNIAKENKSAIKSPSGPNVPANKKTTSQTSTEMRFLEQHFYIDAGIPLESITGLDNSVKYNTDASLETIELIAIESCNITDDAKVNLRDNINRIPKLTPPTSLFYSGGSGDTRNKRHSSIISEKCLDFVKSDDKDTQKRRSLNLNYYSESKIPIANRAKGLSVSKNVTKEYNSKRITDCHNKCSFGKSKMPILVQNSKHCSAIPVDVRNPQNKKVLIVPKKPR